MAYLLAWSLLVGNDWITGMAMFRTMSECQEARQVILEYKRSISGGYIECKLVENDKEFQSPLLVIAKRNEIKITHVNGASHGR